MHSFLPYLKPFAPFAAFLIFSLSLLSLSTPLLPSFLPSFLPSPFLSSFPFIHLMVSTIYKFTSPSYQPEQLIEAVLLLGHEVVFPLLPLAHWLTELSRPLQVRLGRPVTFWFVGKSATTFINQCCKVADGVLSWSQYRLTTRRMGCFSHILYFIWNAFYMYCILR